MSKCEKCKTRWAAEGETLCSACKFVPKVGRVPPTMRVHKGLDPHALAGELAEDDYGEDSTADSVYLEQAEREFRGRPR